MLLGELRNVEVLSHELLNDVTAQSRVAGIGFRRIPVEGPPHRSPRRYAHVAVNEFRTIPTLLTPKKREGWDAIIEKELLLVIADQQDDIRFRAFQRSRQLLDGPLHRLVLFRPYGGLKLAIHPRRPGTEQRLVRSTL